MGQCPIPPRWEVLSPMNMDCMTPVETLGNGVMIGIQPQFTRMARPIPGGRHRVGPGCCGAALGPMMPGAHAPRTATRAVSLPGAIGTASAPHVVPDLEPAPRPNRANAYRPEGQVPGNEILNYTHAFSRAVMRGMAEVAVSVTSSCVRGWSRMPAA